MAYDSTYDKMCQETGAKVGRGLNGLASVAAMSGNELNLQQGHGELAEHYRLPLHPGHHANRDDLRRAEYIGSRHASGGSYAGMG